MIQIIVIILIFILLYYDVHFIKEWNGFYICYRKYIRDGIHGHYHKVTYSRKLWKL
jgi:hypothetical protein